MCLRVLHIIPSYPPNEFVLKDMEFSRKIANIDAFVLGFNQGQKKANIFSTLLNIILCALRILRIRPNVIHCHFLLPTLASAFLPIPKVVTIHESYNWYSSFWCSIFKITSRFFKTIFVSKYNRDYWKPVLGREETVIYHAIDRSYYNKNCYNENYRNSLLNEVGVDYLIFSMGVSEPRRGLHFAIKASSILRKKGYNIGLILRSYGGKSEYRHHLEQLSNNLGVPTKFVKERLPEKGMARLFASVDVFLRPTIVESFGIAVLEAQACGTPCIVTDCCSLKEVFGKSALTFIPQNPQDLANQIEKVLMDKHVKEKYIELGLQNANNLSWHQKINAYLKVYHDAIN